MNESSVQYVGFWWRVVAAVVDTILMLAILAPLLTWMYGREYWTAEGGRVVGPGDMLVNGVLPAVAVILFWVYRRATPGKMLIGAQIVDAKTLGPASTGQLVGRYLAYYIAIIPLMLGIIWVGIDPRKQGFHDKLAGTVVVRSRKG
ncbi:MAG: RDD family protein [Gammaproteobacteria bacterium]|nr:RDD family protein [Gammaproteobacteria bacterium]